MMKRIPQLSLYSLLFAFPIVINTVKVLGNLILLILFFMGLYIVISERQSPFKIKELKALSWITVGYFIVMLVSLLVADGWDASFGHLGRKVHFLLAPFIAMTLFKMDFELRRLLLGIKIGLVAIGIIVIIQWLLQHNRPSGMINANVFGDLAVIMLFLSMVNVLTEDLKDKILTWVGVLFGVFAVLLSGSRGSWISFLVLSVIYFALIYKSFFKGNKTRIGIFLVAVICFGVVVKQTSATERISLAVNSIKIWISSGQTDTAVSERLEMWKSGLSAAIAAPWFGYGYRNANQAAAKYSTKKIANYSHLHNEYLTNYVSAGIFGLVALLILLFYPLRVFMQKINHPAVRHYAVMGVLLCTGYTTFGFTHIALGEEHMNAFYIFFLGFLLPVVLRGSSKLKYE